MADSTIVTPPPHDIWATLRDWWHVITVLIGSGIAQLAAWWGLLRDMREMKEHKQAVEAFMKAREASVVEYLKFKTTTEITAEHVKQSLARIEDRFDAFDAKLDRLGSHIQSCPMQEPPKR